MSELSRRQLELALEEANVYDYDIHETYSGRFMYGKECFGVVVDSATRMLGVFAALGADYASRSNYDDGALYDDVLRLAGTARVDNMGRDTIVYFPGWKLKP